MAGILCGQIDVTKLPEDEIIAIGNALWMKGDVDEKIYIVNGNVPCVVLKFSAAPETAVCPDEQGLIKSVVMAAGTALNASSSQTPVSLYTAYNQKSTNSCLSQSTLQALYYAQNSSDSHGLNSMGYQPAAIMPTAAVVPMRSNIKLYGPYASNNFGSSGGGTQVSVDTDIAPWVFGSIAAMNNAALSIVNSSVVGLTKAETGSITIPGMPDIISLGATVNSGGPNLTNINFNFGSSGATTSYEFKTFTPKFGDLNQHFIAKFKTIAKNRQEQLKMLRNNQIVQNKIGRKIRTVIPRQTPNRSTSNNSPAHQNSLQRIIVGEMYNWQGDDPTNISQRTVVGAATLSKSQAEMVYAYDKKAYTSFDAFFSPVSISGDGGLPRFALPKNLAFTQHTASIAPNPPFSTGVSCTGINAHDSYFNDLTQDYFNPLRNPFGQDEHPLHSGSGVGHNIDIVGRGTLVPESGIITNFYKLNDPNRYAPDYRFLSFKGPLVLHSWGYDLDGKPVPNLADIEAQAVQGNFTDVNLKDYFLNNWMHKPATWPVAPVDLRFDRERGVWVSPQPYKIVTAKIEKEVLPYQDGLASIVSYGKTLYDKEGNAIPGNPLDCPTEETASSGTRWVLTKVTCSERLTVVTDVRLIDGSGLVFDTAEIDAAAFTTSIVTVPTTDCAPPTPTPTPTPTPSQTTTPTPTPTPTETPTPTPTPTSTPVPTATPIPTGVAVIKVVDRLGNNHLIGDLVYAYYDTSRDEYIVLQGAAGSPTIYGTYYHETDTVAGSGNYLRVEGFAGGAGVTIGEYVEVENPLGIGVICNSSAKAIATRFYIQ